MRSIIRFVCLCFYSERLDADIRNFKGNSVKETIKRGLEEMAEHKLQIGDIQGALKYFSKSRDYCLQAHHERSMCLNIIKTASECVYTLLVTFLKSGY